MAKQTAVQFLVMKYNQWQGVLKDRDIEEAKAMEKEQSMDLIKQAAMFMGASNFDEEIASMTYEDVYNSYYKI